jgi:hypothetical protein
MVSLLTGCGGANVERHGITCLLQFLADILHPFLQKN